jgi:asparagine synthase (glutamine-hydrolysing)
MCGFAGVLSKKNDVTYAQLSRMKQAIFHRGPDSSGVWVSENNSIGFCHNRLSIIDISDAGAQPMHSHSNRFVLSYNGEIYNHLDLRRELLKINPNIQFESNSDTETLLCGFEQWGIEKTISKAVGMFAFSVWDFVDNVLYLGRDRMGEKPLYYGWQGDYFFFGSELKSLKSHPNFISEVDTIALSMYFRYSYVPAPHSIYKNIRKLIPGTIVKIDILGEMNTLIYWDLNKVAKKGADNPYLGGAQDAIHELDQRLNETIACQQISDVPIGAFLSGGIDSTLISAIMQSQSQSKINTFTIGFNESKYNEANYASDIARHLNTNHHELFLSADDIVSAVPLMSKIFDEPFADSSQLPTYFVSKLARQSVSVALSGDAGDEIFGGYNRYSQASKFLKLPSFTRNFLGKAMSQFSPTQVDAIYDTIEFLLPRSIRTSNAGNHYNKIITILKQNTDWDLYQSLVSICNSPESILNNKVKESGINNFTEKLFENDFQIENKMMQSDSLTYLVDDILCKVDRSSMAVSLESRVPFLDHRIVEFSWTLPLSMKIRDGQGKWILRQLLNKYVPNRLIERPKMGFGLPLDIWLRGPLREYAEAILGDKDIGEFLDSSIVNKIWLEHLSGKKNHQHILWNILMFQSWKKEWL